MLISISVLPSQRASPSLQHDVSSLERYPWKAVSLLQWSLHFLVCPKELLLAKSLHVFFDYKRAYYHEYSVGFSGILFALKVVLNAQAKDHTSVYGILVPTKYDVWAELILVQMFVPSTSFLGHLVGILAGVLYMTLKGSHSGSDPVTMVVRGVIRAVIWPLRFLNSMVRSRRRRISGRGKERPEWDSRTWYLEMPVVYI